MALTNMGNFKFSRNIHERWGMLLEEASGQNN